LTKTEALKAGDNAVAKMQLESDRNSLHLSDDISPNKHGIVSQSIRCSVCYIKQRTKSNGCQPSVFDSRDLNLMPNARQAFVIAR
jgi:hypothetical protein